MKNDTDTWMKFAHENLKSTKILIDNDLFNPALQNAQQVIEKSLKALIIEKNFNLRKTHSIDELVMILQREDIRIDIKEDEIDLIDSIYLPSKYPLGSALPDFSPDKEIADKCYLIAQKIYENVLALP